MTKKQHHYFWAPQEDRYLIRMKIDGLSTKKIIRVLKKSGHAKRTNSSVNTRCAILKQDYKTKNYQELLQKLLVDNKSEQSIKEDGLKRILDNFYEKKLSPYMKKLENASEESKNYNPLEKYLANDYIVLKLNKIEKKLSEEEKSQLEKILEKLESRKTKNSEKIDRTNKTKNYHYPLPELTPSEIRKKIIKMKKQNSTNEEIYEEFPKNVKQNVSAYLAHFTMGHYHKRKLV